MEGVSTIIISIILVWVVISTVTKDEKKKKSSKANKSKRLKQEYMEVRTKFEGAYIVRKKRIDQDFSGIYMKKCSKDYCRIYKGKVAIWDRVSQEVVLLVQFHSFDEMSNELKQKFEHVSTSLHYLKKGAASIYCIKSLQHGKMFALGWRAGYEKGLSLGRYTPSNSSQKTVPNIYDWKEDQDLISTISLFYRERFSELGRILFEITTIEAQKGNIPDISQKEFFDLKQVCESFASNLTYTIEDFSNLLHQDLDYNSYSYGIWAPIFINNGKLASINDGFKCEGGEFVIPSYKSFVDFGACDGVVEIIWRGKIDFHATIPSKTISGFTRLGTSVQISQGLVDRIRKLVEKQKIGIDINKKVRGVEKIVEEKLHVLL